MDSNGEIAGYAIGYSRYTGQGPLIASFSEFEVVAAIVF